MGGALFARERSRAPRAAQRRHGLSVARHSFRWLEDSTDGCIIGRAVAVSCVNNAAAGQSLNSNLTMYRVRPDSLSSLHMNKIINAFKIYYFSLKFSFLYSIFYVIRLYFNAFKKKYL